VNKLRAGIAVSFQTGEHVAAGLGLAGGFSL
jgi:hypothetical protein